MIIFVNILLSNNSTTQFNKNEKSNEKIFLYAIKPNPKRSKVMTTKQQPVSFEQSNSNKNSWHVTRKLPVESQLIKFHNLTFTTATYRGKLAAAIGSRSVFVVSPPYVRKLGTIASRDERSFLIVDRCADVAHLGRCWKVQSRGKGSGVTSPTGMRLNRC